MDINLLNIKENNNNIVNKINVIFKRKGIKYEKDIYIIMNTEMKENIKNEKNIQYFLDVTYYDTPPNNKKYRILIILLFNSELFRTLLCNISIISNQNKETFYTIFDYLKKKYKFNPNIITIYYSLAEVNGIKHVFPQIRLIPCFFHFMQNIVKRLRDLI